MGRCSDDASTASVASEDARSDRWGSHPGPGPASCPGDGYEEAVHEITSGASDYERHTALTAWRYAASTAVLGITVLERVAKAEPPLTASAVKELCQEPALGRLREALSVPAAGVLPARERSFLDERDDMAKRWAELRDGVDTAIEIVLEIVEDKRAAYFKTKEEAAGCLMTEHSPPDTDPVYMGVLEPLLVVAEEVPYGISRVIKAADGPACIRPVRARFTQFVALALCGPSVWIPYRSTGDRETQA